MDADDRTLIVTRHPGLVEWLRRRGIVGRVLPHVDSPAQIAGRHVYGVLPLHLAAHAAAVSTVSLTRCRVAPGGNRGWEEWSADRLEEFGAALETFVVRGAAEAEQLTRLVREFGYCEGQGGTWAAEGDWACRRASGTPDTHPDRDSYSERLRRAERKGLTTLGVEAYLDSLGE